MEEGYIQSKQRELNEQLKRVEEKEKILSTKIELLERKIGEYNELISKLNHYEKYQDDLKKQFTNEFNELFKEIIDDLKKKNEKLLNKYTKQFIKSFETMSKVMVEYENEVSSLKKNSTLYLVALTDVISMLVDKKIIEYNEGQKVLEKSLDFMEKAKEQFDKHRKDIEKLLKKMDL